MADGAGDRHACEDFEAVGTMTASAFYKFVRAASGGRPARRCGVAAYEEVLGACGAGRGIDRDACRFLRSTGASPIELLGSHKVQAHVDPVCRCIENFRAPFVLLSIRGENEGDAPAVRFEAYA